MLGAAVLAVVSLSAGEAFAQEPSTRLVFVRDELGHPIRTVTLTCDPARGSHPNGAAACRYLASAAVLVLPDENLAVRCIRYYPVSLSATGTLHGRPVTAERTYGCLVPELPAPWQF
jgi:hypothetical protein